MEHKQFISFLKQVGIINNNLNELDSTLIERDMLVLKDIDNFKEVINDIKQIYTVNSTSIPSLKKSAKHKQKWPVLNLTRQILKVINYNMEPIRKSNGYTLEGKKLYKRFFIIKKITKKSTINNEVNININ